MITADDNGCFSIYLASSNQLNKRTPKNIFCQNERIGRSGAIYKRCCLGLPRLVHCLGSSVVEHLLHTREVAAGSNKIHMQTTNKAAA